MHNFLSLFAVVGWLKIVHNFLSLFAVEGNGIQFFDLVDGGWSCKSCMKLLEKKSVQFFVLIYCGGEWYSIL